MCLFFGFFLSSPLVKNSVCKTSFQYVYNQRFTYKSSQRFPINVVIIFHAKISQKMNATANSAQKAYSKADYDTVNSTFCHELILNPYGFFFDKGRDGYRINSLTKLVMYSKKIGFDEPHDKERLLQQEIQRLVIISNYFSHHNGQYRTKEIILIQNFALQDVAIVIGTLYPLTYKLVDNENNLFSTPELVRFLDNLYSVIDGEVSELRIKRKVKITVQDKYDLGVTFTSYEKLVRYCDMLVKSGEPRIRVEEFWRTYSKAKGWENQ